MASGLKIIRYLFSNIGPVFPRTAAKIGVNLFYKPRYCQQNEAEKKFEQTSEISYFNSSQGKLKLYYWKGSKNENVLLVHGWEGRASQLHKFAKLILDEGYGVLAFDGPAHGGSEGKRTTLPLFAKSIEEICNSYEVDYAIGHSFGAGAIAIAIHNGLNLKKAVLIAAPYSVENVVNRFCMFLKIPDSVSNKMHVHMESNKWHGRPRECYSFSTLGESINVPLLVIHDKRDKYVLYEDGCKVHEYCKNSTFHSTQGYGHSGIIKNKQVINKSVNFLFI